MTPAYLERLPFIPMLVSNKADRAKLPRPKSPPIRISASHAEPETALEQLLCEALKASLALETVSIDGDFFKEYAAHSLLMARFCARIRQTRRTCRSRCATSTRTPPCAASPRALTCAKPTVETYAERRR